MKTAIIYLSRYGTTRACAQELAEHLPGETGLFDIQAGPAPDLEGFGTVVVGSPIYGGKAPAAVGRFCENARGALLARTVGLYICCLYEGEKADLELETGYPPWLSAHATAADWFGGAVTVSQLRLVDKFLFMRLAGVRNNVDRVRHDRIAAFAAVLAAGSR